MTEEQKILLLRTYLGIDPNSPSGLVWKIDNGRARAGAPAFAAIDRWGYYYGQVKRARMKAHQAMFGLVHGYIPAMIDHRDGDRTNNDVGNLRASDPTANQQNRTGVGASIRKGRWVARIQVDKKHIGLGSFDTKEAAHAAYLQAKHALHPAYARNSHV